MLHCEDIPLSKLAERYGTPLYVYSASAIRQRLSSFQKAFRDVPHTICYSVKANSNVSILRLLSREGCGFDVVSGGELERVLVADRRAAKKIVFSGVGKSRDEMTAALRAGILLFNIESESELWALTECATRLRTTARVALRVNPDVAADTHPYISTGLRKHKFGIPMRDARELYAKASGAKYLKVAGVSVHIGSQIVEIAPFAEAVARVADLARALRADGHRIDYIDTGGGLGISYQEPGLDFDGRTARYARAVCHPLRGMSSSSPGTRTRYCWACRGPACLCRLSETERWQAISRGRCCHERSDPAFALWGIPRDRSGGTTRKLGDENRNCGCGGSGLRVR
jgi:diaminopimelate decarboxylase